jgi:hypothetical protein
MNELARAFQEAGVPNPIAGQSNFIIGFPTFGVQITAYPGVDDVEEVMVAIPVEEQAKVIERWKSEKGITGRDYVALNNGSRRTPEKRELLRAIAETVGEQDKKSRFRANF